MKVPRVFDVKTYQPSKIDEVRLQEDFKIISTYYTLLRQGKKVDFSETVILDLGIKIIKELLQRGGQLFQSKTLSVEVREFINRVLKEIVKQKLVVEPPVGDLVSEGKVRALVFLEDMQLDSIYLLTQDNKAFGYLRFGALPSKEMDPSSGAEFGTYKYRITSESFEKFRKYHKISGTERRERWGDTKVFWLYPIRDFFPLEKPIQLKSFTNDKFKISENFKPEIITPEYAKELTDLSIIKLHGWLHNGYYLAEEKKQSIERWVNAHAFLVDEMIERKMEHRPWSPLDEKSKEFQVHKMFRVEDYFSDFYIRKPYALVAGSVFISGEGNDLDIIIRDFYNPYFKEAVEHFLSASNVEKTDFVFSAWTSAFTNHLVLYDYGLTRNPRSEIFLQKIKLWDLNLQLPSFTNPEPKVFLFEKDSLLKFHIKEDAAKERDGIIEFKLKQFLPMHYDIEVTYGKYTPKDYKPIYWEVWWREPEPELITMSISTGRYQTKLAHSSKIRPMKYFNTMKPAKAAKPGSPATLEVFFDAFKSKDFPVASQKKFDGVNTEIHRSGNKVKIWTEDGGEVTNRVPQTVEEILKLKVNKFIVLAEAESWDDSRHLPRERAAGYFHAKSEADDSHIVFNVYDIVYTGSDGDISYKGVIDRLKVLETLDIKQSTKDVPDLKYRLNKTPSFISNDLAELRLDTQKCIEAVGSEGVVAKPHWGIYDISGKRTEQIKYHNKVLFTALVEKRLVTKTPGVFVYEWAIEAGEAKPRPQLKVVIEGKNYIHGGRTDATAEKFEKGDLISIEAETINYWYNDKDGTVRISAWVPRVITTTKVQDIDSIKTLALRARKERVLVIKVVYADGSEFYPDSKDFNLSETLMSKIALGFDPESVGIIPLLDGHLSILEGVGEVLQHYIKEISVPKDIKEKELKWSSISRKELKDFVPSKLPTGFFVLQHHWRGKSVHDDLRIKDNGTLTGWTISSAWPGKITKSVDSIKEAAEITAQDFVWKFSPDMLPTKHVFAEQKVKHPIEWLTQVEDVHQEGEVGATRFFEGVFFGYDWGLSYPGAGGKGSHGTSKPWFNEYFLRGRKFNGKLVFRLLQAPEEGKIKEGVFWQGWLAKDEYPYLLNRTARLKRDWLPPSGVSAVPPEIEAIIPPELQYWNKPLSKEAKFNMIDSVYNYLIDKGFIAANKLKIGETSSLGTKVLSMTGKKVEFVFQDEWWKGPEVIRGAKQHRFYVKLMDEKKDVIALSFKDKYPVISVGEEGLAATIHKVISGPLRNTVPADWFKFEGEIPKGHPGYPKEIKELPLHVEISDRGFVQVIEDGVDFKSFQFKGNLLKGYYILRREGPTAAIWLWEKSKLPSEKGPVAK